MDATADPRRSRLPCRWGRRILPRCPSGSSDTARWRPHFAAWDWDCRDTARDAVRRKCAADSLDTAGRLRQESRDVHALARFRRRRFSTALFPPKQLSREAYPERDDGSVWAETKP